jgi:hypothetical protein
MKKLGPVETAKQLMADAMKWSVMTWLREKKNVRKRADQANAALDEFADSVKQAWPASARMAYEDTALSGTGNNKKHKSMNGEDAVAKCKQAEEEAEHARIVAEETFDRAERLLSTALAREGCSQAIRSWELKEHAIRLAEELGRSAKG